MDEVFVEAIEREPDAAAPYLVYADWLLQRGDPRGELIVVQDELARTVDADRQATLRAREREIIDAHLQEWMGGEVRGPRIELTWRRGFLDTLYLDYREADFGGLARLMRSPLCRFVRRIDLRTHVRDGLPALLGSPVLRHLETLCLGSYRWASYSTRGIAARFPTLLDLDCDADSVDLVELELASLRSLGVALNGCTVANLEAIATAELPRLESLLIWGGHMLDARTGAEDEDAPWFPATACQRLLDGHAFPALRKLDFSACRFGDELIDALVDSVLLQQLGELILDDDAVTTAGFQRLLERAAAVRHLAGLQLPTAAASDSMRARLDEALGSKLRWK